MRWIWAMMSRRTKCESRSTQAQEGELDRAESTQEVADVPRGRISVKEKLAQMREKAYGKKLLETPDISKEKRQKEIIM